MQVTLPEGVIKPIIQAQVIAALQGQTRLITEMVTLVLSEKKRDQKSYKDYPFIEMVCRDAIAGAVEAAVREWVQEQAPAIKAQIAQTLRGKAKDIAASLVMAAVESGKQSWRMSVSVQLGTKD
jgi:hypothetical protein